MSKQFNDDDHKVTSEFLGLLVNLGASPAEAYKQVNEIFKKYGWEFVFFNDIQNFWIMDDEMK